MQLSIDLAQQVLSMVLMAFAGFLLSRLKLVSGEQSRIISVMCVYAIIPAALFNTFQYDYSPDLMAGLGIALLASIAIHILYLAVTVMMSKTRFALTREEQASTIYNNCGNLIIPMIYGISTLGAKYVFYTCPYLVIQNLLLWSHGQTIMGCPDKPSVKRMLINPFMGSIFIGLAFFFLQWKLPYPLATAVTGLGNCMGPVCMIVIGIMLGDQNLKKVLSNLNVYRVVFIRLVFFPLLAMVILVAFATLCDVPDLTNILTVTLLCAVGPSAATTTQQAQLYNNPNRGYVSSINAVSTMLCAVTMPIMVMIFQLIIAA